MSVKFVYGKPGTGKSSYIFSEVSEIIKKDKTANIYIITPEQFSFNAEKRLLEAIDGNAVLNAEVITLSRLAHRLVEGKENKDIKNLSKSGKAMLIYSILDSNKSSFKFLNKSDENIDICMNMIKDLKKHGVLVENIKEEIEKLEDKDKYFKTKLSDILIIYENFEKYLENKYLEESDMLNLLCTKLEESQYLKNSYIYIDEFLGFTTQEYNVIKEIAKQAKEVIITTCVDDFNFTTNPDKDIFHSNKLTASKLIDIFNDAKVEVKENINLEKMHRFKTKDLEHLVNNISNNKSTKYEDNVENVNLFLAKNTYSEIENVAKKIDELVKNNGYRYNEIGIITKNIESYSSLVRGIFKNYEIPVFIDEKRDLNQNIVVKYVLSILEVANNNFSHDAIFNYLKSGFLDIEKEDIFKLENYVIKWGITYSKWKKTFELGKDKDEKLVQHLNNIRKNIVTDIEKLRNDISLAKNASNISKVFYEYMMNKNIEKKLTYEISELETLGHIDLAQEYKESYNIIIELIEEIYNIFKEDKISIDKYTKIFKIGLKNSGLAKIPGTQDQVILGDDQRSRSHKMKAVFILGINDGVFPSIRKDEGFLNDADRKYLKEVGLEIANGTLENLYEENFNIYRTFAIPENKMFLSYISANSEGKSQRPSVLINKVKKVFPKLVEKSDVIKKEYGITNQKIAYEELLENIFKLKNREEIDEIWLQIYKYFTQCKEWNGKLESDLRALEYTNQPQRLNKNNVEKLYGNTLHTSVSRLESYRKCPFAYHMQYGLKIQEKEELKIQNFNTGTFLHDIIDEFFEHVRMQSLGLAELEEQEISEIIDMLVEKYLELSKNYMFTATEKYLLLVKRLKRLVGKALKYIIMTITKSDFSIEGTEIEFSDKGKYKPIKIELEDGKSIEITGKIDRVDTATDEEGKFLRIIDYKSSAKNIKLDEVYAGLQIQLLTYSDAICKEEDIMPAGILYFSLMEKMLKVEKRLTDEQIETQIAKSFKMQGLIVADVKIIKMHDNSLESGSSKIVPGAITKNGTVNMAWTSGVTKEEFKILHKHIYTVVKKISKEILDGNIEIKPVKNGKKTPCEYCKYKSICAFDSKELDNNYRYINDNFEFVKERLKEKEEKKKAKK